MWQHAGRAAILPIVTRDGQSLPSSQIPMLYSLDLLARYVPVRGALRHAAYSVRGQLSALKCGFCIALPCEGRDAKR